MCWYQKKKIENLMFGVLIVTCTFTSGPASSPQNMAFLIMPSRKLLTEPPPPPKKKQTALRLKKIFTASATTVRNTPSVVVVSIKPF